MKTKCFKLINDEEIIADVENDAGTFVVLKNPMVLAVVGEGKLAMYPWLPLAEKQEHILQCHNILIEYIPNAQILSGYKQRTGGIVAASPGLLNQLGGWEDR